MATVLGVGVCAGARRRPGHVDARPAHRRPAHRVRSRAAGVEPGPLGRHAAATLVARARPRSSSGSRASLAARGFWPWNASSSTAELPAGMAAPRAGRESDPRSRSPMRRASCFVPARRCSRSTAAFLAHRAGSRPGREPLAFAGLPRLRDRAAEAVAIWLRARGRARFSPPASPRSLGAGPTFARRTSRAFGALWASIAVGLVGVLRLRRRGCSRRGPRRPRERFLGLAGAGAAPGSTSRGRRVARTRASSTTRRSAASSAASLEWARPASPGGRQRVPPGSKSAIQTRASRVLRSGARPSGRRSPSRRGFSDRVPSRLVLAATGSRLAVLDDALAVDSRPSHGTPARLRPHRSESSRIAPLLRRHRSRLRVYMVRRTRRRADLDILELDVADERLVRTGEHRAS